MNRLMVIDLEDAEQVARLADAFCHARWSHVEGSEECDPLTRSSMAAALREFSQTPKPEEPQGLGAVVEDADGHCYVRVPAPNGANWIDALSDEIDAAIDGRAASARFNIPGTPTPWSDIAAVRVLSDGAVR